MILMQRVLCWTVLWLWLLVGLSAKCHAQTDIKQDQVEVSAPLTIEFQQAELSAVLKAFADFTGLNIIASEQVRGTVSMRLDRVPWRGAFDMLMEVHGLVAQKRGNIIWVATAAEWADRERQRIEAYARATELEPLISHTFELHYQRADEIGKLLHGAGAPRVLSKRGTAIVDARTNQLLVIDLAESIEQIQALLKAIDRPLRQVAIEVRIVEAEEGFSRELGARLAHLGETGRDSEPRELLAAKNGTIYELPAGPLAGFDAMNAGFTLFRAGVNRLLALELSALEADGYGKILSSPRIVTADRVRALIEQGTELPYQAKVGKGISGVQFRRASLKLEVTPHITPDGHVVLDVDVSKDSVGMQTQSGPAVNTKHLRTQVQVENGGTVAMGGIFIQDERTDVARVPWLGEIPLLGVLFRHSTHNKRKSELLVFITPNVVAQPPLPNYEGI
ncbi:type IV pilus secretin PilQ [Mycoavidus sp. B2-EB]|uniref:type IV pilus secretin PilQ n=1 Tax=Mycoavidus sp. B2-EB TaxID=2651972 RepID=UPI001624EA9B|nr:type IV pilus secretin PilQ [Mycoavidus sp. B2-EB]BBO59168.1 secretin [Mycoavidus sp. B2-EB]